jgi:hypothetical protein
MVRVTDTNGKRLQNATVTLTGQTVQTDADGVATFSNIPTGKQRAQITFNGATRSYDLEVHEASTGQAFTLVAGVAKRPIPVALVVILTGLLALSTVTGFVLRRPLGQIVGTGHARPIRLSVALSLVLFVVTVAAIMIAGLAF